MERRRRIVLITYYIERSTENEVQTGNLFLSTPALSPILATSLQETRQFCRSILPSGPEYGLQRQRGADSNQPRDSGALRLSRGRPWFPGRPSHGFYKRRGLSGVRTLLRSWSCSSSSG